MPTGRSRQSKASSISQLDPSNRSNATEELYRTHRNDAQWMVFDEWKPPKDNVKLVEAVYETQARRIWLAR
jgi:hypothetical protein